MDAEGGFDAYVAARGPALLRFAYLLTGDRHRGEDLVQAALVKAYRSWSSVAAADHPDAYVRRIVVRENLSWRRRRASGEVLRAVPDELRTQPDGASGHASRAAAWDLLGRLPAAQRAVLVLRFYEDLDDTAVVLLRETLAAHEDDAPSAAGLADAVRARAARGRTRTALAAAAAVAAVALVGTGATLLLTGGASAPGPVSTATDGTADPLPTSSRPAPAPGSKRVSSLGVEVDVPQGWPVVGAIGGCEPLPAAVVVRGGGLVAGCGYTEPATLTLVEVTTPGQLALAGPQALKPGTRPTTQALDRVNMDLTVSRLADGRTQEVLTSKDRDVAVVVRGPDEAVVDRVAATATLVDVDDAGCPVQQPARPRWDSPDRPHGLALGQGVWEALSVCLYEADARGGRRPQRLTASGLFTGGDLDAVRAALVAARPGPNPDEPASDCLPTPERASVLLRVRRATGVTWLRVHYDGCVDRYVASPHGVARVSMTLLAEVYNPLAVGYGASGGLDP